MPTDQLLLPFSPASSVRNNALLSNHWLEHRFPLEPEWTELREEGLAILERLGALWRTQKNRVEQYGDEQGLEGRSSSRC